MSDGSTFKCSKVFNQIDNGLKTKGPSIVQKLKAVYCFKVKNGPGGREGAWVIDVKTGSGSVKFHENPSAAKGDCTLCMDDEDLYKLMVGELNAQQAFMKGKLKIIGNMGLALKLRDILGEVDRSKL